MQTPTSRSSRLVGCSWPVRWKGGVGGRQSRGSAAGASPSAMPPTFDTPVSWCWMLDEGGVVAAVEGKILYSPQGHPSRHCGRLHNATVYEAFAPDTLSPTPDIPATSRRRGWRLVGTELGNHPPLPPPSPFAGNERYGATPSTCPARNFHRNRRFCQIAALRSAPYIYRQTTSLVLDPSNEACSCSRRCGRQADSIGHSRWRSHSQITDPWERRSSTCSTY